MNKILDADQLNDFMKVVSKNTLQSPGLLSPMKSLSYNENIQVDKPKDRVYMDGAFDMIHSGHYNAIRQGKQLCEELVVGVNSSEDITKNKGPPILTLQERSEIIRACKWVGEVVEGTKYTPDFELLDELNCVAYAHGDDPAYNHEGVDICQLFKDHGKFRVFKRTEGVSTTDIIGRLLMATSNPGLAKLQGN